MHDKHNEFTPQLVDGQQHIHGSTTVRLQEGDALVVESGGVTVLIVDGVVSIKHHSLTTWMEVFTPECKPRQREDITSPQPASISLLQRSQPSFAYPANCKAHVPAPAPYESNSCDDEDEIPSS